MKKYVLLLAAIFTVHILAAQAHGQDSIWDAVKQAAEEFNADQAEQGNESGENAANGEGQSAGENAWGEDWQTTTEEYAEVFRELSSNPDLSCVAMMVLYVFDYMQLLDRTENEADCRVKYDLYGMQLLAMSSSTTIMYCPEGLAKKSDDELDEISDRYLAAIRARYEPLEEDQYGDEIIPDNWEDVFTTWQRLYVKSMALYDGSMPREGRGDELSEEVRERLRRRAGFIRYLVGYFDPRYIVPRTVNVGSLMEDLKQTCNIN